MADSKSPDCQVRPRELSFLMVGIGAAVSLWGRVIQDPEMGYRLKEELIPFLVTCVTKGGKS
jgi:hypothetical protein